MEKDPDLDLLSIKSLVSAERSLRLSLDRSRALSSSLALVGNHFDEIRRRLHSMEFAARPIVASREALAAAAGHIDRAVGPAAAVLKVLDAVHGLETPLLGDPRADLPAYLSLLQRLEEAICFLSENGGLAVQWLEDIVDYLSDHSLADSRFLSRLKSSLESLKSSSSVPTDGGLLFAALEKLEAEFRRLLADYSSPLPVDVISKLHAILERMKANSRLDHCVVLYVDVRVSGIRTSLAALDLGYLDITRADFEQLQSNQIHTRKWASHLEYAIKHLFEAEFKLCADVFEPAGPPELWTECFAEIAAQANILAFFRFGKMVAGSKKDPIKLLKLLDMFSLLNKLRLDFNRLFGGKACAEIRNQTRDLIKGVIDGACEIFWELPDQVELQRENSPPPDGSVPRLVCFINGYCNTLLGEDYLPVLTQVVLIHRSWDQKKFKGSLLLTDAILDIMRAIEMNFENWSKGYEDAALTYLFMMNTHWHFFKSLKGTKLGELLGDVWLMQHKQYEEYYSSVFLRETWGKLPVLLSREGLILLSGGRATARDLVKKRLKTFNEKFEEMHKKQSSWVISDKDLREKTYQAVVQAIVPVYRSYMQNYGPLVEQDASASRYAKYTADGLEKMLDSLFQYKPGRSLNFRPRHSNKNASPIVPCQNNTSPIVI